MKGNWSNSEIALVFFLYLLPIAITFHGLIHLPGLALAYLVLNVWIYQKMIYKACTRCENYGKKCPLLGGKAVLLLWSRQEGKCEWSPTAKSRGTFTKLTAGGTRRSLPSFAKATEGYPPEVIHPQVKPVAFCEGGEKDRKLIGTFWIVMAIVPVAALALTHRYYHLAGAVISIVCLHLARTRVGCRKCRRREECSFSLKGLPCKP